MKGLYNSNERPVMLKISVATKAPENIRVKVLDGTKANTVYMNRTHIVKPGKPSSFLVRMPISPITSEIIVYNDRNGDMKKGQDPSFTVADIAALALPRKIEGLQSMKPNVMDFVQLAEWFSKRAGFLSAATATSPKSSYFSKTGNFRIDFYNEIKDESGKVLRTPARISITRGVIEVSAKHFRKYTVPQRLAILFHEYSHFYENADAHDEIEADLNGLLIYLGLGYPRIEAKNVFLDVFNKSPSDLNRKRDEVLEKFIDQFDSLDFTGKTFLNANGQGQITTPQYKIFGMKPIIAVPVIATSLWLLYKHLSKAKAA